MIVRIEKMITQTKVMVVVQPAKLNLILFVVEELTQGLTHAQNVIVELHLITILHYE